MELEQNLKKTVIGLFLAQVLAIHNEITTTI